MTSDHDRSDGALGSEFLPTTLPTNPTLEASLRENKDDSGPFMVYADWLEAQGSAVGELVALAAALEQRTDASKQQRVAELERQLGLPTEDFARWGYRHGFWRWLRFENASDWMDDSFDAVAFAHKVFATPLCAALDELRLGVLRWDHNSTDVPAVLAAAADHGWAGSLARLHLGDVENVDLAHHAVGVVGAAISRAFPRLRWLKIHSGAQDWRGDGETLDFAELALPKLETLIVETCAMTQPRLAGLLAGKLPAMTKLELWFGSSEFDAGATAADLAPLLDGKVFDAVTDLGLRNLDFMDDLVDRLGASNLAPRLVRLDLSKGTLDDASAARLAAHAKRFTALRTLDVDDSFLTADGVGMLASAFAGAEVVSRAQSKLEDAEDGARFVSVHE